YHLSLNYCLPLSFVCFSEKGTNTSYSGCCDDRITATHVVTSHESSQIPHDRLVTVIRLLQALMLQMVISSLPNLLTAWYSALYCPSKSL
uniref:Uncharacterized protein n=1 Tax=Oncorhynchus kisutch TaxID=8019 RepID=A0A8C7CV39_ONCKI